MRYTSHIRFLDRYAGAAICFVLTLVRGLRSRRRDGRIKRVLVIELVEMGASVMAYSSLAYIKKTIPDAQIYCLCTESTKEPWMLLDAIPAGNVYAIDNSNPVRMFFSIIAQVRALSKKDIDVVIDYELFTRISAIISFFIRAKYRAGFYGYTMGGLYRGNFLDIKCNFNQNLHISKNLLALTKSAVTLSRSYYNWNAPIGNDEILVPSYRSDPDTKLAVRGSLSASYAGYSGQPLILIAPTVGQMLPMRDYPKEQYVDIARRLLSLHQKHLVVLVGTPPHDEVAEYIRKETGSGRCINFTGKTASLAELAELFRMADLLVTNDSGNPHFAAMAGLPTVALYGPETPYMYGPLGKAVCLFEFFHTSPSITTYNHKNPPSADNECLRVISPERVVAMAQLVMEGKAAYNTIENRLPYIL